ncbi:MAG: hypothetical protein VCF25_20435, partial [Candidatus Poribacteria bacterium]
ISLGMTMVPNKKTGPQLIKMDLMPIARCPQLPPVFPFDFYDNVQIFHCQRIEAASLTKFHRLSKICLQLISVW